MNRILYIEDSLLSLHMVRKTLKHLDYEIIEALDGKDGLVAAHTAQPDLILLDIILPDMDGTEVLKQLKADPYTCSIPVIALTSGKPGTQPKDYLDAGFEAYLTKPINRTTLLRVMNQFLYRSASIS